MITLETRFEGFDARSWARLIGLVAPGIVSHAPHEHARRSEGERGVLFVLYHGTRVLRALHSQRGIVEIEGWTGRAQLEELARTHGARFAIAAEAGALEELYERVGGRVRTEDEEMSTLLVVLGAIRELYDEQQLHVWPSIVPQHVPLPSATVLARSIDYVLPEGKSALIVLFDAEALDTSLLVQRRGAVIERIAGPELLRDVVGPLGGDYRRDYRVIRAAVERDIGPLAFGLYTETETLRVLLEGHRPGAWGEAIASRDVVFDPLPGWTMVAAGAGVVRAAARRSKGLLAGLGVLGALSPTVRRVREIVESVNDFDLERMLGFDPLRALSSLLRHGGHREDDARDGER